jgi:hypothetical protein
VTDINTDFAHLATCQPKALCDHFAKYGSEKGGQLSVDAYILVDPEGRVQAADSEALVSPEDTPPYQLKSEYDFATGTTFLDIYAAVLKAAGELAKAKGLGLGAFRTNILSFEDYVISVHPFRTQGNAYYLLAVRAHDRFFLGRARDTLRNMREEARKLPQIPNTQSSKKGSR